MKIEAASRLKNNVPAPSVYSKDQLNDRMNWIVKYQGTSLEATYVPTNETFRSRSRKAILARVNRFIKEKQEEPR